MSTRNSKETNKKTNKKTNNPTKSNNTRKPTNTRKSRNKNLTKTNNINNATSSLNFDTNNGGDELVEYVMKKYEESLFMPYLDMNNQHERAMHYLDSIINRILSNRSAIDKPSFKTKKEFLIYFIKTAVDFLNRITFPPNPNVNYIYYHGEPTFNLVKVPRDCIICFTTPINYLGCPSIAYIKALFDNINANVGTGTFISSFLKNPFCLKDLPDILEPAITFLPGQFYNDIVLHYDKDNSFRGVMGLYISSEKSPLIKQDYLYKENQLILLSELIKQKKLNGIIIVSCCRSFDIGYGMGDRDTVNAGSDMYRYEHFANIVNNSVWAQGNDESYFEPCIRLKLYPDLFKKTADFPQFNLIKNAIDEKQIGNRSLGTAQHIPKLTGFSPDLLKLFIDKNTNKMKDGTLYTELDKIFSNYPLTLKNKLIDFLSKRIDGDMVSRSLFRDFSIILLLIKYNPLFHKLVNRLYKYFIDRYNKKNKSDDYLPRIFKDKTPAELDMLENTLTF